ncbi:putative two-component system response regulator [Pseudonocardia sp. Ae168_Ps1]|uniref:response regulator transcription factor n=1 Tax=unclassified Pseudonocardia TaxID=2619320 RepID=UPI00094AE9FF|nr:MULTISPECIES: response regulator transcription factor [unclassified Pseudonocardia]OLL73531.1 putative two-component system response regulator [Pseudonocardia sp. Ae150A_Ps1]OLL79502.1 putative two-component system response regulator [Pseudonocardia sp. Ae168_Ps1]OLL86358.1 putative two-component system response regulator [Pseudonocardia sp. Ae263_Ps1]OLL93598.1 putative two-component system response regulator [Pseudonocardia sp. Ae356_Ps1]
MTRLLVADDEHLIRDAIIGLLDLEDDFDIVGRAASGDEALATALALRPDVAMLDLQLPGPDGIEVARRLATQLPQCRCIIVTSHARPGYLKAALAAGVCGFLPKTTSSHTLAEVVRTVAGGGRYVDPELAAEAISAGDSPLTPRESDVLALARDGAPIDEIARRVSLSPGTVRNHLAAVITKLGTTNRHEAVQAAARRGWI